MCYYALWAGSVVAQAAGASAVGATMGVAVLQWALFGANTGAVGVTMGSMCVLVCVIVAVLETNAGAQRLKCKDVRGRA